MASESRTGAARVLFIEDDADVATSVRLLLGRHEIEVLTAPNPAEGLRLLAATAVDAILLDLNFSRGATSGEEGLRCLADILEQDAEAVVVVVTGHSGVNIAVAAMRAGASDFVTKPWSNERLVATVRTAAELRRRRRQASGFKTENVALLREAYGQEGAILGASPAMGRLRALVARAGPTDANVLILGENGTGKELVARAIHQASPRAGGPFIPVDLAAVPEAQLESELFGHKRGATPEAETDRAGRFVSAHGGTLFLDEIGNLPLALQVKLLSALERRQVTPVGGDRPVPTDVRLVASTNMPREQLYSESTFRADLLYRLNTVEISVPPLRERGEDVVELARHYLRLYARRYGRPEKPLTAAATAALKTDPWPGNVRALRHAMERAVILSEGAAFEASDFPLTGRPGAPQRKAGGPLGGGDLNLMRSERWLIEQALQRHHYNVSHAARDLGLTRAALYRRMEKHGL
jgi:DNA-binding NtrC family response regulator